MASGDVLAIPFPPITAPLLGLRATASPLSRRHPSRAVPYVTRRGALAGAPVEIRLFGPPGARWRRDLRSALRGAGGDPNRWFVLALDALLKLPLAGPDELRTPEFLRAHWRLAGVIAYEHQQAAARRVLFEMGGRAILADEVGLGKTIEAGIILHELILRRLVQRALILVPPGLMWQWYRELRDKFDLHVDLQASPADWDRVPLLIASLDTAKRPPHREAVLARPYDLVVVDEAHRLKNHRTRAFQLVESIRSRYLLLLTATPVHNTLRELHALTYLVAPDEVGPFADFARRFGTRGRRADDPPGLRDLVRRCMVRHRRASTPIPFTGRVVHTVPVQLTPAERRLYDALDALSPHSRRDLPCAGALVWLTLKREACSSPAAAAASLRRMAERLKDRGLRRLADDAAAVPSWAKAEAVIGLVERLSDEHVLIFTEYTATQEALAHHAARLGRPVVLFHGGLTAMQREWAQAVFRERAPLMVSTDAGAEGVNLQFCRHLINVDLPWNPMRIEQRIGRLHRLGQTRDVHIWNVYATRTVEEYVLHLLHEKLDLFRTVVGEVDQILEPMGGAGAFEAALADALGRTLQPGAASSLEQALEDLVRRWQEALQQHRRRQQQRDRLLGLEWERPVEAAGGAPGDGTRP